MTQPLLSAARAFLQGLDQSTALDPAVAQAIDLATEALAIDPGTLAGLAGVQVLDVRRQAVFLQAGQAIPGARWCNPVHIGANPAAALPPAGPGPAPGRPLVAYCVHGHAVSRAVVLALRASGHDARFLRGGLAAWVAAGLPHDAPGPDSSAPGPA